MENGQQPAYPTLVQAQNTSCWDTISGLTKREYFAGLAMQGICAGPLDSKCMGAEMIAKTSVSLADALLKALETKTE